MGIQGLLPFVRRVWQETDLSQFAGATVAVDIYCWMHKGAFACAEELALNKPTDKYVYYCVKLIKLLLRFRLKPILIFDGQNLPSKSATETKRREMRESNRRRAARCLAEGKKSEAREFFERSIDVTPAMALRVMEAAHKLNVDCIVAPYESDAQIAFLCQRGGIADLAISEDSDLLPFGCERVIFKLDINSGRGILIERERLLAEGLPINGGLSGDRFRHMCLLAGCDYYSGINGVGLTTAAKVMSRTRLGDLPSLLSKLRMYLPRNECANLSPDEKESLLRAERTFLHQVVFDCVGRRQVPLTPHPRNLSTDDLLFAGKIEKDQHLALQMALGNVDIRSRERVKNFSPTPDHNIGKPRHLVSIWDPKYAPSPAHRRLLKSKSVERKEKSPEGQTGRDKVVKVTYHPPKVSSGSTKCKVLQSEKSQLKENEKSETLRLFSQYFTNPTIPSTSSGGDATSKPDATSTNTVDNDIVTSKESDSSLCCSPISPVFHRSHNRFAVSQSTSLQGEISLSPQEAPRRPRFSLDQLFSSINHSDVSVSNVTKSLQSPTSSEISNDDSPSQSNSYESGLEPEIGSSELSPTLTVKSGAVKKRPLSPSNDIVGKEKKFARTSSVPQVKSGSSLMNWCLSAPTTPQNFNEENRKPHKLKSPSVASMNKPNAKTRTFVKSASCKRPTTSCTSLVGQVMSLWKKPEKEKIMIPSRVNDEVIDLE